MAKLRWTNKGIAHVNSVLNMADCINHAKENGWTVYGVEYDGEEPCQFTVLAYNDNSKFSRLQYEHYGQARLKTAS